MLYDTVQDHMEFAIVWFTYLKRDIECPERVQRRATLPIKVGQGISEL